MFGTQFCFSFDLADIAVTFAVGSRLCVCQRRAISFLTPFLSVTEVGCDL